MDNYNPITDQELKTGHFILTNRDKIKKAGLVVLILLIAGVYIKLVFSLVKLVQAENFQSIAVQIHQNKDWASYHNERSPRMISVSATQYLPLGAKRYNLIAFVNNLNDDWAVSNLEYNFVVNNEPLPVESIFLNPGESRMIIKTGYNSPRAITNLSIQLGDISWRRFNNDTAIVGWDIKDIVFTPASNKIVDDNVINTPAKVEWSAQNLSLHNFWEVGFQVAIFAGDKLVGINEIEAGNIMALQTRSFNAVWLNNLPRVTKTIVYPVLNWLDTDNFKEFYSEPDDGERVEL